MHLMSKSEGKKRMPKKASCVGYDGREIRWVNVDNISSELCASHSAV